MNIKILGNTTWGSTLSALLSETKNEVSLIVRKKSEIKNIVKNRLININGLDIRIPSKVKFLPLNELTFEKNDVLIIAVPSHSVASNLSSITGVVVKGMYVISATKGLSNSGSTISQLISSKLNLKKNQIGVISGPNLAGEIISGKPAVSTIAFENIITANKFRDSLSSTKFRLYSSDDVMGAEIGGALKNILAIGCGIIDGFNLGDNAKSAFMTRGLREITRFGVKLGAKEYTFFGLSGIGDMIATCTSTMSRNWNFGYLLASSKTAASKYPNTVEGINTTAITNKLAKQLNVSMPITEMTQKIIKQKVNPELAIKEFMERALSEERN